jgi:hypothetical protein
MIEPSELIINNDKNNDNNDNDDMIKVDKFRFKVNSNDLKKQRETFQSLSDNFYVMAKGVKLSSEPIYQQYCPMKKAAWLSSESAVKNPYYGSSMLTCGKVTDTL